MIDADEDRLEALERRGRVVGLVIVELVLGLSMAAVVLLLLHSSPVLYASVSVVRRYGVVGMVAMGAVLVVVARRFGYQRALLATGGLVLAAAGVIGVMPHYGGDSGGCRSVLGDFWGSHGDEDETCYDVRQVQTFDVASTAGVGLVLVGAGAALAGHRPTRKS